MRYRLISHIRAIEELTDAEVGARLKAVLDGERVNSLEGFSYQDRGGVNKLLHRMLSLNTLDK